MLRFFRHIRQRLLLEGKVSRYIGYAVGEIVLIVVGILIALEANEWKEERRVAQEEQHLLALISDALDGYIYTLERGAKKHEEVVASCDRLIRAIKNPSKTYDKDSLDRDITIIISTRFLVGAGMTTNIYDVLIDGGKLGILSSPELQTHLRRLKQFFGFALGYDELLTTFVDGQLSPFLNQHIDRLALSESVSEVDSGLHNNHFTTDYEILLDSRKFSNLLDEQLKHTESILIWYPRLYKLVSDIDELVTQGNPSLEPKVFERIDFLESTPMN